MILYPMSGFNNASQVTRGISCTITNSKTLTITAKAPEKTQLNVGATTYQIEAASIPVPSEKVDSADSIPSNIYVNRNDTYSLPQFAGANVTITDAPASLNAQVTPNSQYESYAVPRPSVPLVVSNSVSTPISDCLYTFTEATGVYTIQSVKDSSIYLNIGTNCIHNDGSSNVVTVTGNGDLFTLTSNSIPLKMSNWINFNGSDMSGTTCNVNQFYLYTPAEAGQKGSEELPGYVRVSQITSGSQYLIAAHYAGTYYYTNGSSETNTLFVVNPHRQTDGNNRNMHIVQVSGSFTSGTSTVTIQPSSVGTFPMVIQASNGTRYSVQVHVYDAPASVTPDDTVFYSETGAASLADSNSQQWVANLTISTGSTYDLATLGNAIGWFSTDDSIASVDQHGVITVHQPASGTQDDRKPIQICAVISAYDREIIYALPVTVQTNTYPSTMLLDFYVSDVQFTTPYFSYATKCVTEYGYTNFIQLHKYDVIYLKRDSTQSCGVHFFAKPTAATP